MMVLKFFLNLLFATNRAIVSRLRREKESPDSTEHCTGEEPGISTDAEKYVEITDSATENNCLLPLLTGEGWGEVENVG